MQGQIIPEAFPEVWVHFYLAYFRGGFCSSEGFPEGFQTAYIYIQVKNVSIPEGFVSWHCVCFPWYHATVFSGDEK